MLQFFSEAMVLVLRWNDGMLLSLPGKSAILEALEFCLGGHSGDLRAKSIILLPPSRFILDMKKFVHNMGGVSAEVTLRFQCGIKRYGVFSLIVLL